MNYPSQRDVCFFWLFFLLFYTRFESHKMRFEISQDGFLVWTLFLFHPVSNSDQRWLCSVSQRRPQVQRRPRIRRGSQITVFICKTAGQHAPLQPSSGHSSATSAGMSPDSHLNRPRPEGCQGPPSISEQQALQGEERGRRVEAEVKEEGCICFPLILAWRLATGTWSPCYTVPTPPVIFSKF